MTDTFTLNFYPIAKFIILLFATVGIWNVVNNFLHIFARMKKDKIDAEITNKLIDKYPDVGEVFMNLPLRQQNIENNQEIHEINEKFDALEKMVKDLQNANRT